MQCTSYHNFLHKKIPYLHALQGNREMGARYLDPKYSRWISVDPALGEYASGSDAGRGGIFNQVNLNVYHYGGNSPVRYIDPNGKWHLDPLNGQWIVDKGDTLWGKFGDDWQAKTGYTGDPTKLQIGERIGPTRWTSGNGTGADINSFPDIWEPNAYGIRDEEGNVSLSNLHVYAENFSHPTGENDMDMFVVAGHGNEVEGKTALLSKDKNADIGPKALADAILNHPNYKKGQEILLVSCFIGRGDNSYAQKLANALGKGAVVWASTYAIKVDNDGTFSTEDESDWIKFIGE